MADESSVALSKLVFARSRVHDLVSGVSSKGTIAFDDGVIILGKVQCCLRDVNASASQRLSKVLILKWL